MAVRKKKPAKKKTAKKATTVPRKKTAKKVAKKTGKKGKNPTAVSGNIEELLDSATKAFQEDRSAFIEDFARDVLPPGPLVARLSRARIGVSDGKAYFAIDFVGVSPDEAKGSQFSKFYADLTSPRKFGNNTRMGWLFVDLARLGFDIKSLLPSELPELAEQLTSLKPFVIVKASDVSQEGYQNYDVVNHYDNAKAATAAMKTMD